MKLDIGAGKHRRPGFYCVDAAEHPKAKRPLDLVHVFEFKGKKLKNPLPLKNECASELHNYHFIEHFYSWEAPGLLCEFHRLLENDGKLIIECPDVAKCAKNLFSGKADQFCMWGLYGDPSHVNPYMCHKWGYTPQSLTNLLMLAGFNNVTVKPPKTHGAKVNRDMRIEAIKC